MKSSRESIGPWHRLAAAGLQLLRLNGDTGSEPQARACGPRCRTGVVGDTIRTIQLREECPMPEGRPPPDVLSMVVCDQIITDRATGKQSLIGMFSRIHAQGFPASHPQLCIFVALTDGYGETELEIRIVDANDERPPLVAGKGRVRFKTPRAIANLALQFHGLTFPEPGEYRVQLWAGGELLREARLEMVQLKLRRRKGPDDPKAAGEPEPPPQVA